MVHNGLDFMVGLYPDLPDCIDFWEGISFSMDFEMFWNTFWAEHLDTLIAHVSDLLMWVDFTDVDAGYFVGWRGGGMIMRLD